MTTKVEYRETSATLGPTTQEIANVIDEVNQLALGGDWSALEDILAVGDDFEDQPVIIVARLRAAYAVKSQLPSYATSVESARLNLAARGLDAVRLLRGL